jgi:ribosomal protein L24E
MATATLARTKTRKANNSTFCNRIIDFGNGVMFTAKSEEQARTVEWLVSEAKAGRMILPKSDPTVTPPKPDLSDMPKDFNFDAFYAKCKENRY